MTVMEQRRRRAHSADRAPEETRLVGLLEQVVARRPQESSAFKAPRYQGKGDVEYFISRFRAVSEANRWDQASTLLHLQESLIEEAETCGRAASTTAIYTALRARFGLSVREARSRLTTLRKGMETSLQEHAMEVERLVGVAYADLPVAHRAGMILDTFSNTLGNAYLQRHLLAVHTPTVEDAVRAGNEFLQVRPAMDRSRQSVRQVEDQPEETGLPETVAAAAVQPDLASVLVKVMGLLEALTRKAEAAPNRPAPSATSPRQGPTCWGCNRTGHIKRDCPRVTRPAKLPTGKTGNGERPQQ